jgi:hypothetical protein
LSLWTVLRVNGEDSMNRILRASTLAAIGLGVLASPAAGVFTVVPDVASGGLGAANPQVATDANGDSALTWEFDVSATEQRVQARTMPPSGALGPVHDLSGGDFDDFGPRVAIDAQGDSVFAWTRPSPSNAVLARRLSAGASTPGPAFQVSPGGVPNPGVSAPEVATDANGDTVFTWVNLGSFTGIDRVQARTMTSRGVLGTIRNVSPSGQIASHPQVATDASGDSVITWVREDGVDGDNDIVQARTMTVNGSLGPIAR